MIENVGQLGFKSVARLKVQGLGGCIARDFLAEAWMP